MNIEIQQIEERMKKGERMIIARAKEFGWDSICDKWFDGICGLIDEANEIFKKASKL